MLIAFEQKLNLYIITSFFVARWRIAITKQLIGYERFEGFTAVTIRNAVFWDVTPCSLVKADILEERSSSIISVTKIGELGTTLRVTTDARCE
jgi:hypothetical protein